MLPLDLKTFRALFPRCPAAKAEEYLPYFIHACWEWDIESPLRLAAFCAQLGHESGDLRWWEEFASGEAYEGRLDLGNTEPGDGRRFKGHGPIQITGRKNHRACGKALGVDLENEPTLLLKPEYGFRAAGWFWNTHKLNDYADKLQFDKTTKIINGGWNGKEDRHKRWVRNRKLLGC